MKKNQLLEMFAIGDPFGPRLQDPISAISGGIGLVGNVVSGILGKNAASEAGDIQNQAGQTAGAAQIKTAADVNPAITQAAQTAGTGVTTAAGTAASNVAGAGATAGQGATTAAGKANTILDPYSEAGKLAAAQLQKGVAPGGQFNATPTAADIQIDPGYAWRLQQGQLALDRSAAARGGAISGAAVQGTEQYAQGLASQEYQNAFQRYQQNRQNNYADILGISNQGQAAGTTQGGNLINAAQYAGNTGIGTAEYGGTLNTNAAQYAGTAGINAADLTASNTINAQKTASDYLTGGAAAKAAGLVGGTNALTSGITGGINAGTGALTLSRLLKNPALAPTGTGGNNPYYRGAAGSTNYSGTTVNPDGSITVH
jgi:hypothetical protein